MKRLDTADKLNGSKVYAIDVTLPGMLCAAVKDCPVYGGKLKSYDESKIAGRPGVKKVVRVKDTAVAVVADTWWRAKSALDALPIEWDEGPGATASSATIAEHLKEGLTATATNGEITKGDAKAAIAGAAKKISENPTSQAPKPTLAQGAGYTRNLPALMCIYQFAVMACSSFSVPKASVD